MAYTLGNWYCFEAFGGNSGLFLNREGSGAIHNHQNISIYKNTTGTADNPDHQFRLVAAYHNEDIEGCSIRSMLNEDYGLNIYGYGSDMTAEANCNLAIVGGTTSDASNYNDTLIDLLTVDGDQMLYRIKLIKHPGLFLTATSNSNNADVRWMKESGGSNQLWKLRISETSESSGGGSSTQPDSALVTKFIPASENNYNKDRFENGGCISEITIHHCAGNMSIESLGALWQNPNREGSSHYGVCDNQIGQYVKERDVAWTNGNRAANWRAVTIETSNCGGEPDWPVSDASFNTLVRLVADIAKRNGLGKLVKGKNLTWHSMYAATACPGPYLYNRLDLLVERANALNDY